MTTTDSRPDTAARAELSPRDFDRFRALIRQLAGIHLPDTKRELVASRVRRRLVALGMTSFTAYHDHVVAGGGGAAERTALVNAITTNKTDFFREPHHFAFLRQLAARWKAEPRRPLRIWSAGCSTGEEPYSIAMTLHDLLPAPTWDVKIVATDIDTDVLAHARDGRYREDRLDGLGTVMRFFERGDGALRVRRELRERIEFSQLNLTSPWDLSQRFDVVFCRNVIIYFDRDTQRALFQRLAQQLTPTGHLFLGHSETMAGMEGVFEPAGQTIYQRCDGVAAGGSRRRATSPPRRRPTTAAPRRPIAAPPAPVPVAVTAAPRPPAPAAVAPAPPRPAPPPARVLTRSARPAPRPVTPAAAPVSRFVREHGIPFRRIVVGEAVACDQPTRLSTLLGSCVAACLYDPVAAVGGMNHFLLPSSSGDPTGAARYGVNAMELLINEIMRLGGDRRRLQGKLFGASHVLDLVGSGVPERNAEFAREFLATEGIPVIAERLCGDRPLEIQFLTDSGRALVRPLPATAVAVRREEERAAAAAVARPTETPGSVELWT